jgi:lipoyl(octanoyl) transferase
VGEHKIASIGLRIRRGRSYHGLALNVAMDLEPFARINPCGYAGLQMTQVGTLGGPTDVRAVGEALAPHLLRALHFDDVASRDQSATSTWLQDVSSR